MRSKVFIVCEPMRKIGDEFVSTIDLTPAAEWGEIEILLQHKQMKIDTAPLVELLFERLADYSDDDYIVPVGDPSVMCAVAMVAAKINSGRCRLLRWNRLLKKYFPVQFDITRSA